MRKKSIDPSPSSHGHSKSSTKQHGPSSSKVPNQACSFNNPKSKPMPSQLVPNQQGKADLFVWVKKVSSKNASLKIQSLPSEPPPYSPHKPSLSLKSPSSPSSTESSPSSPKLPPTLRPIKKQTDSYVDKNQQGKAGYSLLEKDSLPMYRIPRDIKNLIKKDIVPLVLKQPLSPLTYKNYFAALLHAEEFYLQKWSDFKMDNVTLMLEEASVFRKSKKKKKNDKIFLSFEIDHSTENRPFLLSRDLVYARPSGRNVDPYEGILYRVVKSSSVLVDFGEDFHSQHHPRSTCTYDISFSLNRICFKRAHHSIEAASNPLFHYYLFPNIPLKKFNLRKGKSENYELDPDQIEAVHQILSSQCSVPHIVEGQPCFFHTKNSASERIKQLSKTGAVILEAVLQIYRSSLDSKILICAPLNSICDEFMIRFSNVIPESDMFRANAAFRDLDEVPAEILPSCLYDGDCFGCPNMQELMEYRVILSTYVSCFRLHNANVSVGHFTHIFLVDNSLTTEPETMIALANFADDNTSVVISGSTSSSPCWVRSRIGRRKGLQVSYFERLLSHSSA